MKKLPYGISHYPTLIREGYYFVDKTMYIKDLEEMATRYHFFLRPRRFGKSLWVSMLEAYYDVRFKGEFEALFGQFFIGKHKTPRANTYRVLSFDFSKIRTQSPETTQFDFDKAVQFACQNFIQHHDDLISEAQQKKIFAATSANIILGELFSALDNSNEKLFVLIDEYDHFTNELLSFSPTDFAAFVGRNGFIRKFFEVLKAGTGSGLIGRIFATGVSPVTLDSLTSGFNIGEDLTADLLFHDMMGFVKTDVAAVLSVSGVKSEELEQVQRQIQLYYNGYKFHPKADFGLFNADMVLYFAKSFERYGHAPDEMLDTNIVSDYGKIDRLFKIGDEQSNWGILEELFEKGEVAILRTRQFSFERPWTNHDFASLLLYNGLLTVKGQRSNLWILQIPNYVVKELYFNFYANSLYNRAALTQQKIDIVPAVDALANEGTMEKLTNHVEEVLHGLSNRDDIRFDEKHLKIIFAALLFPVNMFLVQSEVEIGRGYLDLLLRRQNGIEINFQHAIELKYLKKSQSRQLKKTIEEGRAQLIGYLKEKELSALEDLRAWLIVFVGTKAKHVELIQG